MNTESHGNNNSGKHSQNGKLLYGDLTYRVRGIVFDIRSKYGPGQKESVYHNLLEEAFNNANINNSREQRIKIISDQSAKVMGYYQPDFIIDDSIILEIKSARVTTKTDEKQLYHYLRNSEYQVGLLINFSTPKLFIKRIIYTNDRKPFLRVN